MAGIKEESQLEVVSIRLVRGAPIMSEHRVGCPEDAIAVVGDLLCELDREVVCVINLKADGTPINCNFASMGAVDQSLACPRELFKSSILSNAAAMIIVHNHPSGDINPSRSDTLLTDKMLKLCGMMGIALQDHVIIGGDNSSYFSFRKKEMLCNPYFTGCTDYKYLQFDSPVITERGR